MSTHELRIRITAPNPGDGEHWAISIRDLVAAEHGQDMRLAFDGPHLVNEPGSTTEQLPADLLAVLAPRSYLSTACQTARSLTDAALQDPGRAEELERWRDRMHQRCRLNHKFTGELCTCRCHQVTR